ncbi:hypothetical protein [Nocardioides humilatus]|uniref:hypothetical protein n=1 Tax=Nocardioides humilatus TaxID=2607660 RepID=UPI00165FE363|nr:hypothetical protein [Nocardioides humilatus]
MRTDHSTTASGIFDLVAAVGQRHVARSDLPAELQPFVREALGRGLLAEDCRDHLFALI